MITDERAHEFLTAYGATLASYDAEATAELWGMPGTMLADGFVGVISSREEMATGLAQGYPLYRRTGLAGIDHTLVEHTVVTETISRLRVRWHFLDAEGTELVDSTYEYTVREDEDRIRAYVAVDIDGQAKLAELLERLGIDPEA